MYLKLKHKHKSFQNKNICYLKQRTTFENNFKFKLKQKAKTFYLCNNFVIALKKTDWLPLFYTVNSQLYMEIKVYLIRIE